MGIRGTFEVAASGFEMTDSAGMEGNCANAVVSFNGIISVLGTLLWIATVCGVGSLNCFGAERSSSIVVERTLLSPGGFGCRINSVDDGVGS